MCSEERDIQAMLDSKLTLAVACLSAALAACSSTNPYTDKYERLNAAYEQKSAGELEAAAGGFERLVDEVRSDGAFDLQRFFAQYCLAQTHVDASLGSAFLTETSTGPSGIGSTQAGGRRPSEVAHMVASVYHGNRALGWAQPANGEPTEVDGQRLLPPALEDLGLEKAQTNLQINNMIALGRLGFFGKVAEALRLSPQLTRLDECRKLLADVNVPEDRRPWVYLLVHEFLRSVNEPEAYKFGILAIQRRDDARGTVTTPYVANVAAWIDSGSTLEFVCPRCQQLAIPDLEACIQDGHPTIDFTSRARAPRP